MMLGLIRCWMALALENEPQTNGGNAAAWRTANRYTDNRRLSILSQLVAIQDMLMADILNPETSARERAQCACAWERIEDRKRIHRMKPKPRDVDTLELANMKLRSMKKAPTVFLDDVSKSKPIDVRTESVTDSMPAEPPIEQSKESQSGRHQSDSQSVGQ